MARNRGVLLSVLLVVLVSCAAPPRGAGVPDAGVGAVPVAPALPTGPQRISIGITAEPTSLYYPLIPAPVRAVPGSIQELVSPGLVLFDNFGALRPLLVEAVPSIENGLWRVLPDGRMETTWRIKPEARWQDGTPLTSEDLSFTLAVSMDRELAVFGHKYYGLIEGVETPDSRTVTVRWKQPLIQADWLFTYTAGLPMPKHLLERAYTDSKATFADLPFWSQDFVGHGPFKLKEWARGSHLILTASDQFVLGRPKLDEIEVRFIGDSNTLISNVLAGSVDLVMRQALSADQALQMREQWRDGKVGIAADGWVVIYPQFVNANPAVVLNVDFRRALLLALDRQQLADTLMAGLTPVADSVLNPDTQEYKDTVGSIVRYPYDPQRAARLIEGLGYTKGPDGGFRDAAGQRLSFETRATTQRDIHVKTMLPVVDYWKTLGLNVDTQVIPAQRATDREEQATFPAFQVLRQPAGLERMIALHSSEARLPERNFTGSNNGRYSNAELDTAIDRYLTTIPRAARNQAIGQAVHHFTDQLPVLGLFYDATPSLTHNRLQGVTPLTGSEDGRQAWNSYEWFVR